MTVRASAETDEGPREQLFEFKVTGADTHYRCDLVDYGLAYGIEVQFLNRANAVVVAKRFAAGVDAPRSLRGLAIAWAKRQRKVMKAGSPSGAT
jgi:hypothetical protein